MNNWFYIVSVYIFHKMLILAYAQGYVYTSLVQRHESILISRCNVLEIDRDVRHVFKTHVTYHAAFWRLSLMFSAKCERH
jgi:hypothetical protein